MRETFFHVLKVVVSVVIPLASLATGLRAATVDPFWLLKRPSLLLRSLLAILVLVPLGTLVLLEAIRPQPLVEVGLLVSVLAVGIGPPAAFKQTGAADANVAYEVELNVILMTLAIVFIPVAVALLGRYFDRELRLAPSGVATLVLTRALIPLLAGILVARLLPKVAEPLGRVASPIIQIVLLLVVVVALAASGRAMMALGVQGWALCAAVALGAVVVGHLCGGPDPGNRRVLAIFSSMRFPGLALVIASAAPVGRKVVPVVLAYVICSAVFSGLYGAVASRRQRTAGPPVSPLHAPGRA